MSFNEDPRQQAANMFDIEDNLSYSFDAWHKALAYYCDDDVSNIDHDIKEMTWLRAREYDDMPDMGNIIQQVVLEKLKAAIIDKALEEAQSNALEEGNLAEIKSSFNDSISFFINCKDSHFIINQQHVNTFEAIEKAVDGLMEQTLPY